ncbi:hypothetical protein QC764_116290 [Podospora pseudoanserina]|uniref:C2H2-type domain-containing protein n=1 Tax=Podospora pseudoanserina TaxID=2609844 RepID=A0ABR0IPW1_9PEZI|nr:hypothetical protein QC764_116290 [Podospora pseudoanserina]
MDGHHYASNLPLGMGVQTSDVGLGFGHLSVHGGPIGMDAVGDPMDLDMDFDEMSWAIDFNSPINHIDPQQLHSFEVNPNYHPPNGLPYDYLFAEDEGYFPPFNPPLPNINHRPPEDGSHDLARERLRKQLSLLSKGWCGDEIRFKNVDPAKAVILHTLAIELGLEYNHNVRSQEVLISRFEPTQLPSGPRPSSGRLSTSPPRASVELNAVSCLPGESSFSLSHFQSPQPPHFDVRAAVAPIQEAPLQQPQPDSIVAKPHQALSRHPSRSERITDSISKHVSTLKASVAKGGRRGPLTENGRRGMRELETVGGACWRCKVLRRKCDPGTPCRCCLQLESVAMPNLGEDAPLWPLIGCRRGPLGDSLPTQLLCPLQSLECHLASSNSSRRCRSVDLAERCLLSAESQRLADMKAVFEGASDKLSICDFGLKASFYAFIDAGRYRDRDSLHQQNTPCDGNPVTYAELIAIIAWELSENNALLGSLLEIKSWENFMGMLETACIYESEVGQTSVVFLSMVCLRHCLEGLRLHSAQLLVPTAHDDCSSGDCQVDCIRNLYRQVTAYVDELSAVMFNKENMRDRRWWLSTFYSLCIQSYVRHALIAIEKQLRFKPTDDVPAEDLSTTQYLHLAALLFTAASAKYDPLIGGRLQYALTDNSVIPETSVPELAHSSARVAFEVDQWASNGIRTSYQFLRKLLQIGSLDFVEQQVKCQGQHLEVSGHKKTPSVGSASLHSMPSPISPNDSAFTTSTRSSRIYLQRNSIDSRFSAQPSTIFSSNLSSDSLAQTLSTAHTSLYEPSILTNPRYSAVIGEVDLDMVVSEGEGLEPEEILKFVCECCPRGPRHFRTYEELSAHEAEKPHLCTNAQCKKRFKSPTEAERHINAIHLKSESWSCKALTHPLLAFHMEIFPNGAVWDVCGFCGGGFARKTSAIKDETLPSTGETSMKADAESIERDEAELISHMERVHKFGECDREKHFYRADNFRQHLRNTHIAKPGKWLKVLEGVCKIGKDGPQGAV